MKKILFVLVSAFLAVACSVGGKPDYNVLLNAFHQKVDSLFNEAAKSGEEPFDALKKLYTDTYLEHKDDSLGLAVFIPLITSFCSSEEALALYEGSSDLIKENTRVKMKIESFRYAASVAPGNPYKEISGTDALTGVALKLSSFLGGDKPLLVDFWASWCGPCRNEIKTHLLPLAAEGRVNIVGVAVWEDSVEDTRKAMSELGISWPVIFTGDRDNSPSVQYGVLGIPTLFLISPEGTILASGHSIEEFAEKL